MLRTVVIGLSDGTEKTQDAVDNPFEIEWDEAYLFVRFYLNHKEVGTVYAPHKPTD